MTKRKLDERVTSFTVHKMSDNITAWLAFLKADVHLTDVHVDAVDIDALTVLKGRLRDIEAMDDPHEYCRFVLAFQERATKARLRKNAFDFARRLTDTVQTKWELGWQVHRVHYLVVGARLGMLTAEGDVNGTSAYEWVMLSYDLRPYSLNDIVGLDKEDDYYGGQVDPSA